MTEIRFSEYMDLVKFVTGHCENNCWDYVNCFSQYFVNKDFFKLSFYLRQLCRHRSLIKIVDLWRDLKKKKIEHWEYFFIWLKINYNKDVLTNSFIVKFNKCACSNELPKKGDEITSRIMFYDLNKKRIEHDGFGKFEICNECIFNRVSNKEFWLPKEQMMSK